MFVINILADISIIEFAIYGLIAYTTLIMLIISTIKEVPMTRAGSILRAVWLIPGVIASALLSQAGPTIVMPTTTSTLINLNTTETWTETVPQTITLQDPVFWSVNVMIFITLSFAVLVQMFLMLSKTGAEK